MAVLSLSFGPYTQAGGPQTIALTTTQRSRVNHCVAFRFTDAAGAVVTPSAGTFAAFGRREGGSMFEPFEDPSIDATTTGGFDATQTPLDSIRIEPTAFPADLRYYVVINSTDSLGV